MKPLTLDYLEEVDFFILAINSHAKGYKLCWDINKKLNLNFVKNKYHKPEKTKNVEFSRFTSENKDLEIEYNLISNYSKGGYLLPKYKNIDYFLKIQNYFWEKEKEDFIGKLRQIPEILLTFEFDLDNINSLNPFIFCDKKN
ncbi:MAG: IPExxxVDY family protein [Flavobacteriales bacterium]|nr:IPExxxVDY family protein [Flavobacteriales bacterium]